MKSDKQNPYTMHNSNFITFSFWVCMFPFILGLSYLFGVYQRTALKLILINWAFYAGKINTWLKSQEKTLI